MISAYALEIINADIIDRSKMLFADTKYLLMVTLSKYKFNIKQCNAAK